MLWYCEFTWHPGTTATQVRKRIVEQHDSGSKIREHMKGWYNLAGGGAGFLLLEVDDPAELSNMLMPYMDLLAFDVRGIYELKYDEAIQRFRSAP